MPTKNQIVKEYARMWPREVFYHLVPNESGKGKKVALARGLELVNEPGCTCSTAMISLTTSGRRASCAIACGSSRLRSRRSILQLFGTTSPAFVIENPKLRDEG